MKRKIIALFIVTVMVASMTSITALGDTGSGEVIGLDTRVISVTLPTAKNFEFVLDPQGLLSATEPNTPLASLTGLGLIHFPADYQPVILNSSSRPVDVGVEFVVTGGADVVPDASALGSATTTSIDIGVLHSNANVETVATASSAGFVSSATSISGTNTSFMQYYLGAANYVVNPPTTTGGQHTYVIHPTNPSIKGTQFMLNGKMNITAGTDWSGFMGSSPSSLIELAVRYAFQENDDVSPPTVTVGNAFVGTPGNLLAYIGENTVATTTGFMAGPGMTVTSPTQASIAVSAGATSITVPFNLGGESIVWIGWGSGYLNGMLDSCTISANSITIPIAGWPSGPGLVGIYTEWPGDPFVLTVNIP